MNGPQKLPQTGYTLDRVYTSYQKLEVRQPSSPLPEAGAFTFGWDWFIVSDRTFEVVIRLGVDPTPARIEEIRVSLNARFTVGDDTQSVGFAEFIRYHAVAILMPYAREAISSLASRGFYGSYVVPPVNVMRLMNDQDPTATRGARQLLEGRSFALLPAPMLSGDVGAVVVSEPQQKAEGARENPNSVAASSEPQRKKTAKRTPANKVEKTEPPKKSRKSATRGR